MVFSPSAIRHFPRLASYRRLSQQHRHASQTAYIAFGSNVGNRMTNIYRAIESLNTLGTVTKTSFLYESLPMYNENQPNFLNGVVQLQLSDDQQHQQLNPYSLLRSLKEIESKLGRDTSSMQPRNSPRTIDLDILLFGEQVVYDNELNLHIPHPRICERPFVLKPLIDIEPSLTLPSSNGEERTKRGTVEEIYKRQFQHDQSIVQVTPLKNERLMTFDGKKTLLMGILNVTPDSFSDGGQFTSVHNALKQTEQFVRHGFDIIDIGGQSTRPGADQVSEEEELERVLPAIQNIRREFPEIIISLDTFYSRVAKEGIDNGIDIVNDVTSCKYEVDEMSNLLNETKTPVILMHMRGTSKTMNSLTGYNLEDPDAFHKEIADELLNEKIFQKLIYKWNVIADCGIGFSKTFKHNVLLMQQTRQFKEYIRNYPCLLGISRKSWIKHVLAECERIGNDDSVPSNDMKDLATTAALINSINNGGVDIVRVHQPLISESIKVNEYINNFSY